MQHHYKSGGSNKFRGRAQRPQTDRQIFYSVILQENAQPPTQIHISV